MTSSKYNFNCPNKSDTPAADNGQQTEDPSVFRGALPFAKSVRSAILQNKQSSNYKNKQGLDDAIARVSFNLFHTFKFYTFSALQYLEIFLFGIYDKRYKIF